MTEAVSQTAPPSSPFLAEYELDGITEPTDPNAEAYMSFLNELYNEEFDEALFKLFQEASSLVQDRFLGERSEQAEAEDSVQSQNDVRKDGTK